MLHRQGNGRGWKFECNLSQKPISSGAVCRENGTYGSNRELRGATHDSTQTEKTLNSIQMRTNAKG